MSLLNTVSRIAGGAARRRTAPAGRRPAGGMATGTGRRSGGTAAVGMLSRFLRRR